MKKHKVRRIDFSADEWLSGTVELLDIDRGVYITICALIYSRAGPVHIDLVRAHSRSHGNRVKASVSRLAALGKITVIGSEIDQNRCEKELEITRKRIGKASENGKKGGRPRKKINDLKKAEVSADEKLTINHQPSTINHQESGTSVPASRARASRPPDLIAEEFARWYAAYPHKVGPPAAEKAYRKARARASPQELLDGVQRYIATKPPDRNWCNPATWLNQERWRDEPAAVLPLSFGVINGSGPRKLTAGEQRKAEGDDAIRAAVEALQSRTGERG